MQVTIEDVQAQRGGMAQFQAVIEGNPQPTVTWYKVGRGLSGDLPAGGGRCVKPPLGWAQYSVKIRLGGGAGVLQGGLMASLPSVFPGWHPAGGWTPAQPAAGRDHILPGAKGCGSA